MLLAALGSTACDPAVVIFTPTTGSDGVDATIGDGTCATAGGVCTLRAAIQEANAMPGFHVIVELTSGIPGYALTLGGAGEDAGATGDLDVNGADVEIRGNGALIYGNHLDRVLDHHTGTLVVSNLLITAGVATSDGGAARLAADATFDRVTFADNSAGSTPTTSPGGFAVHQSAGNVRISHSLIERAGTSSQKGYGGPVTQTGGTLVFDASVIRDSASDMYRHIDGSPVGSGNAAGILQIAGDAYVINSSISGMTRTTTGCYNSVCGLVIVQHGHGVLAGGNVRLLSSVLSTNTFDFRVLTGGTGQVGASVLGSCAGPGAVTSLGFNRTDLGSPCGTQPSDGPVAAATTDQVPVGTALLCDGTIPTDRLDVARPQGAACDIGDLES